MRVPTHDTRVVIQRRCRPNPVGPGEKRFVMMVVVPRRPNDDGGGEVPRRRRIIPRRSADRHAAALERARKKLVVLRQLGLNGVRREQNERARGVICRHSASAREMD